MEPEAKPKGRGKRIALVVLATGAVLLVTLEILARVRFGTPLAERLPIVEIQADPRTGWRMRPGREHYTYTHRVQVNALGLRGPEVAPKADGERRVLALGDSLIYGQGVADDQTVPAHLEALLGATAAPDERWTVVNAGHRAYDTHQELRLLDALAPTVAPDVVVLFWFWNDIRERNMSETNARLTASGPIAFDTGEAMEGGAVWRWRAKQLLRRSALLMTLHDLWRARNGAPPARSEIDAAMQRLDGYLDGFVAAAEAGGFELWFAALPDANALVDGMAPDEKASPRHFTADITAHALALARAKGIPTCDVEPALEELARDERRLPVLPYDGHYTGNANRAIAAAVAACLRAD